MDRLGACEFVRGDWHWLNCRRCFRGRAARTCFLREAYGPLWAFSWAWAEFCIIRSGSIATLAAAMAITLGEFAAALRSHARIDDRRARFSIGSIVLLAAINIIGTRWERVQNVTTLIKVAFVAFLALFPFVAFGSHDVSLEKLWPTAASAGLLVGIGSAVLASCGLMMAGPICRSWPKRRDQDATCRALGAGDFIANRALCGGKSCVSLDAALERNRHGQSYRRAGGREADAEFWRQADDGHVGRYRSSGRSTRTFSPGRVCYLPRRAIIASSAPCAASIRAFGTPALAIAASRRGRPRSCLSATFMPMPTSACTTC